ncbi:hypothetical protein PO587_14085 [Streptomyces gilvifuscus]|uniref:Uncharacterized protein n=1 Tax=Streptomyces gilvifuscus TaxID=1550617 RepID=A0ABT5FSS7_9ACTN|nr:hypothetical protein [Streptomyces gilvifuscus]MDC2955597.1 hypothetical protein [Streptomyces gilvifuscus]
MATVLVTVSYGGYRLLWGRRGIMDGGGSGVSGRVWVVGTISAALIAAVSGIIAAMIISHHDSSSGSSTGSASRKAAHAPTGGESASALISRTASPKKEPGFEFYTPDDGSPVHGSFIVKGQTPPLGSDTLWLFDYAGSANAEGDVYYRISQSPIEVNGATWSTSDGPLGRPHDDIGARFKIVIVRAAPLCSATLKSAESNSAGDVIFRELPSGCRPVGKITVTKAS